MPGWQLTGERSFTLLAAVFRDRPTAERAALSVLNAGDAPQQVSVVSPGDRYLTRRLEPDPAGIWRTAVRSHGVLGAAGLLLGALGGLAMVAGNVAGAAQSPAQALVFGGVLGLFGGLIAGGLVTLRPDHARVIARVRGALARRRHAVVVRPVGRAQTLAALHVLRAAGGKPVRSF